MKNLFQIKRNDLLIIKKLGIQMRLIAILLFSATLCLQANVTYSQNTKVNLDLENATFTDIFREIEKQSDYRFFYNNTVLNATVKLNLRTGEKELSGVLDQLFDNTNMSYQLVDKYIVITHKNEALPPGLLQTPDKKQVTGIVLDESGDPVIGANVIEKNTTNGITTSADGRFSLNVGENAVLQISYIGYVTQEIAVGNRNYLSITLREDLQKLEEVVIVGYGTQKRGLVTGSLSVTGGDEISQSKTQNLSLSLQGRLPGVVISNRTGEPGAEFTSVNIRGRSTTGNNDPLILVDGIANRGSLDRINPNDIESVTVLKDASAAIYGSRSANGVILVTTKRGKEGKPMINYSCNVGLQAPTRLPELADAATYAQVLNEIETFAGRPARYTDNEIQKFRDGSDPIHYPNTDWFSETLRKTALQQRHNVSIRGANDRIAYYLGGGFSHQDAIYKNSSTYFKQYDIRSNIDAKITKNFNLSLDLSGRMEDQHFSGSNATDIFWILTRSFPTALARYPNGLPTYGTNDGNPVTMVNDETGYRNYKKSIFNSTITARVDLPWITQGLSVDGYMAFDKVGDDRKEWYTPTYYYEWDEATDTYEKLVYARRLKASLRQEYQPSTNLTLHAKMVYNRTFASHSVDAMVGIEQNEYKGHNYGGSRNNYLSTAIDQLFAGSSNKEDIDNFGSAYEQARRSLFGRFAYDYAGKYMAQFNFRYDGSYIFASGERWGFFPGVSLGWRLSEEHFLKEKVSWLNNLKLRLSYGQQGNDNVDAFQYLLKYAMGRNYVFGNKDVEGVYPEGLPNEAITWEVANTYNIGLDGMLWKGKLGFEIDLFRTVRSNILTSRDASMPQYTGLITLPQENIGKVQNQGLEFLLTHYSKLGQGWGLNLSGNFLYARNKVIYIDETPWGEGYDYMKAEGKPLGTDLYYHAIGIYRTPEDLDKYPGIAGAGLGDLIYEDVDGNGVIDGMDRVRANLMHFPEIVFGLNIGLDWKGFDLSMLLQGQGRAQQLVHMRIDHTGNAFKERTDNRWTPDNINGTMPRVESITSTSAESDFWMKNASFLRLKNLEIGYTLPRTLSDKLKISNARIYLNGYNLFTFDKLKVMDPESDQPGANYYPQMKIFNTGISLTF
jgi:TonB-linked SusC/RagA family outer membrane protein